jgi:hypothetical protein
MLCSLMLVSYTKLASQNYVTTFGYYTLRLKNEYESAEIVQIVRPEVGIKKFMQNIRRHYTYTSRSMYRYIYTAYVLRY